MDTADFTRQKRRLKRLILVLSGIMMKIRNCSFEEILLVHSKIPEMKPFTTIEQYKDRIGESDSISLIAEDSNKLVGFKLGYWLESTKFYSWLGGVIPSHRKKGVAKSLLLSQENDVWGSGGKTILVKSMNKYPEMIIMLISNGYKINGFEKNEEKIHFIKSIT